MNEPFSHHLPDDPLFFLNIYLQNSLVILEHVRQSCKIVKCIFSEWRSFSIVVIGLEKIFLEDDGDEDVFSIGEKLHLYFVCFDDEVEEFDTFQVFGA